MRADLTSPEMPDWRKHLFPCDADDHHFVWFDWWQEPDEPCWGLLEVIPAVYAPTWRQRVVTAVKVLFGRRAWTGHGVLLNEATVAALRTTCDEFLDSEDAKRQGAAS